MVHRHLFENGTPLWWVWARKPRVLHRRAQKILTQFRSPISNTSSKCKNLKATYRVVIRRSYHFLYRHWAEATEVQGLVHSSESAASNLLLHSVTPTIIQSQSLKFPFIPAIRYKLHESGHVENSVNILRKNTKSTIPWNFSQTDRSIYWNVRDCVYLRWYLRTPTSHLRNQITYYQYCMCPRIANLLVIAKANERLFFTHK